MEAKLSNLIDSVCAEFDHVDPLIGSKVKEIFVKSFFINFKHLKKAKPEQLERLGVPLAIANELFEKVNSENSSTNATPDAQVAIAEDQTQPTPRPDEIIAVEVEPESSNSPNTSSTKYSTGVIQDLSDLYTKKLIAKLNNENYNNEDYKASISFIVIKGVQDLVKCCGKNPTKEEKNCLAASMFALFPKMTKSKVI